jgi:hypothetical protein
LCTKVNMFCGQMITGGVGDGSGKYSIWWHRESIIGVKGSAHGNIEGTECAEI